MRKFQRLFVLKRLYICYYEHIVVILKTLFDITLFDLNPCREK